MCYSHNQIEVPGDATYLVCGECFHVYETAEDLEAADVWAEKQTEKYLLPGETIGPPRVAAAIFACPYCGHDF